MKILVIGLDCAAPELLFTDERLVNVRRLMGAGCYGRLESVIPPITIPAWRCMVTSQDPYTKYWMNIITDRRMKTPTSPRSVMAASLAG